MASLFPTTLDNFTNNVDNVDTIIAQDINDLNDAVENLQTKVGIDNSAVSTSIDYILKNKIWPIGSVFTAVVATSPATLLGFGTWSQIAGGKVLIGQTDGDADFNVAEETGGAKTATLTTTELPAHAHTGSSLGSEAAHVHAGPSHSHGVTDPTHTHGIPNGSDITSAGYAANTSQHDTGDITSVAASTGISIQAGGTGNTGAGSSHTHSLTIASAGSGTAFSIMNPYFCVYFWKRTA